MAVRDGCHLFLWFFRQSRKGKDTRQGQPGKYGFVRIIRRSVRAMEDRKKHRGKIVFGNGRRKEFFKGEIHLRLHRPRSPYTRYTPFPPYFSSLPRGKGGFSPRLCRCSRQSRRGSVSQTLQGGGDSSAAMNHHFRRKF